MKKKVRILFMINSLYGGGAEKVLQTLLGQLDSNLYEITLYGVINEPYDDSIYPKSITYKSVFSGKYHSLIKSTFIIKALNKIKIFIYNNFSSKLFYKLFIKGEYDVEVAFIEGYSTRIISGSTNNKSKKLTWVHIDLEANHWSKIAYKSLKKEIECYRKYNSIICVSESVKRTFTKKFGISKTLNVCYNPLNVQDIIAKGSESITIPKNKNFLICAMGRLEVQKGFDRLIHCVKKLVDKNYPVELWIIGKGNDESMLINLIDQNNLNRHVKLLGFQSNPYKFINQSDLFVCSSRSEGFSLAIGEAYILNIPVLSTNCTGPDELLHYGEYGLLVENSENGIYDGLVKILDNSLLLEELKSKSKERAKFFSLEKSCKIIESQWK